MMLIGLAVFSSWRRYRNKRLLVGRVGGVDAQPPDVVDSFCSGSHAYRTTVAATSGLPTRQQQVYASLCFFSKNRGEKSGPVTEPEPQP